jgi:hypothetical protein
MLSVLPYPTSPLLPQPLQLPQHHQIRIQKPIHALPHARLLVFVQLAVLDVARGYAFAEAGVGQGVYCWRDR